MTPLIYSLAWDTEEKLGICVHIEGKPEWSDARAIQTEINGMIDTVEHRVAVYFTNGEEVTRNMPDGMLTNIASVMKLQHPRMLCFFLINPNPSMMFHTWNQLAKTAIPKSKQRFFIVPSLAAARQQAAEISEFQRGKQLRQPDEGRL